MNKKVRKIIETLGKHEDTEAIAVLEELGTNSQDDEVRELTSQVLVRKNIHDALKVVIINKGKGINDMSPVVAMSTINEILNLNVEDVKNKKYITVKQCDAGVKKKIPLNKEIQELIKFVIKDLDLKSPLFVSIRGKRMERTAVYTQFKNVCRTLDLSNISIASVRKTFGYHYYQKYKDLSFLQWLFNQSTVIATMKYIGVHENLSSRFNLEFSL